MKIQCLSCEHTSDDFKFRSISRLRVNIVLCLNSAQIRVPSHELTKRGEVVGYTACELRRTDSRGKFIS
jgi:hypothetical protein